MPEPVSFFAWWGAGLSTTLAAIRCYELWRDRFRLDVSYNFTGSAQTGNEILIRNLSNKPAILAYWELFYRPSRLVPWGKEQAISSAAPDSEDRVLSPYSTLILRFADEEYFAWGINRPARNIYIRLHVAGDRPRCYLVYSG